MRLARAAAARARGAMLSPASSRGLAGAGVGEEDGDPGVSYRVLEGNVGLITLNAPHRLNAFTEGMAREFSRIVDGVRHAPHDQRVGAVVLCATGKSFCAGGDLGMLKGFKEASDVRATAEKLAGLYLSFLGMRTLDVPVVAAIHGHCVGGGAGIALAADLRFAMPCVQLRFNFARELGIHPGMGTTHLLPRLVGAGRAAAMLLQTPPYGIDVAAPEALEAGLISAMASKEEEPDAGGGGKSRIRWRCPAVRKAVATATALAGDLNPAASADLVLALRGGPGHWEALVEAVHKEAHAQAASFRTPGCRL